MHHCVYIHLKQSHVHVAFLVSCSSLSALHRNQKAKTSARMRHCRVYTTNKVYCRYSKALIWNVTAVQYKGKADGQWPLQLSLPPELPEKVYAWAKISFLQQGTIQQHNNKRRVKQTITLIIIIISKSSLYYVHANARKCSRILCFKSFALKKSVSLYQNTYFACLNILSDACSYTLIIRICFKKQNCNIRLYQQTSRNITDMKYLTWLWVGSLKTICL